MDFSPLSHMEQISYLEKDNQIKADEPTVNINQTQLCFYVY